MLSKIFNLNDPGWGKKPQNDDGSQEPKRPQQDPNSPPDLDQVWSDVEKKFQSSFLAVVQSRWSASRPRPGRQ
ncbi:hypothetical protein OURE66S_02976 [Oligella ureolytica]